MQVNVGQSVFGRGETGTTKEQVGSHLVVRNAMFRVRLTSAPS